MPLDVLTRTLLENFTAQPPHVESAWYGPWTTILTTLFPASQGYIVTPQQRFPGEDRDFIIEVTKLSTPPVTLRTVLIIGINNTQHWPSGIQNLRHQLETQADAAFSGTARNKVYWIGVIGPHWQYGEKIDDGGELKELIEWHDTTHDLASFNDLQTLVRLVDAL
ncbi:hypothetical protein EDD15DRAFT_1522212 [Pisolithus albus]|nr:hypothetical protein EDD15DRAFT_1522212 [Pisolithus albus]